MIKSTDNEKNKFSKNNIYQKQIKFESNKTYSYPDISQYDQHNYINDKNYQNFVYNTLQNNNIYKKPSINNANIMIQSLEESKNNNNIINEMRQNIKQNESKLEKMNKTIQEIFTKQNKEDPSTSKESKECKEYYSQINELEKIQQENLTLKADSIIYREDILHLSEINKKLKIEFDLAQKKIFDLISKAENSNLILNNKNYEIAQLTEVISNIKLNNSTETMKKIKNNKTIEQKIFEYEFELDGLNKEKIKLETEIKNLEEKYNLLFEEKTKNEQEEEFYKNQINENILDLETKVKNLGNKMNELSIINKELKLKNQNYENEINLIKNEKNDFFDKYNNEKEKLNELENEFKNLENKYGQLLYDIRKRDYEQENNKIHEIIENKKFKNRKSSKQLIVNDLYNKIKEIKKNIQSEREINNN